MDSQFKSWKWWKTNHHRNPDQFSGEVSHHFQPPKDPLGTMLSQHAVERQEAILRPGFVKKIVSVTDVGQVLLRTHLIIITNTYKYMIYIYKVTKIMALIHSHSMSLQNYGIHS